ncbi:HNH endonuclease [Nocardia camponoti]|uniref:HNH endonuclease 5 domain-containing protein n=1 Tax=Nocardia camponoti TaxID=1616106 RepID=A0A917QCA8_9NOCA|nr:HNH endonuclease [Nocardia camponoti]GGK43378.1 hypothetical protein GCM10011591_13770 [Nocardia camponoti]
MSSQYPDTAFVKGVLWWNLTQYPNKKMKFGATNRIAAWLHFNKEVGDTFTIRELREVLGDEDRPVTDEHFGRRLRELRALQWQLPSQQEDSSLKTNEYRIRSKGWHPALGKKPSAGESIRSGVRRRVLEEGGSRCVHCGTGSGEPYPEAPHSPAVVTIGHRIPRSLGGSNDFDNLQVECQRCNEPVRDEAGLPTQLNELHPEIKGLKRAEKETLLAWLRHGHRTRSRVDIVYDRCRLLSAKERDALVEILARATSSV